MLAHAAVAHAQFETIHPFPDGNGRTGRALVHAHLRHKRLTRNRDGDPTPIVERFAEAALVARELGIAPQNTYRSLAALVAAGILVEFTDNKRNRMWRSPEVLDALDRFAARAGRRARGSA